MSSFPHLIGLDVGAEKVTNTVKKHPLGARGGNIFGEEFAYCFSGSAVGAGQVIMGKAGTADSDQDLVTQTAGAVGDQTYSLTLGNTAVTLNEFADGVIYTNDGPGEGHKYRILSHPAADASATLVLTLYPNDKIREATTTADTLVGLMHNQHIDVIPFDANAIVGPVLGVAVTEVANDAYFWAQTDGLACVNNDTNTTVILGDALQASQTTDGSVELADTSADNDSYIIGMAALIAPAASDSLLAMIAIP